MENHAICRLVMGAVLAFTMPVGPAGAQSGSASTQDDFPNRPIKLVVPFTPGGGTDMLARILAAKMAENLGQSVVVENRPGGNTLIATEIVVRAPADGYTLLLQTNNLAANPTLYRNKISFDTVQDLVPVSLVAGGPHVLVVNAAFPARTLAEFVALAKAKPGTVTYASAGSGSVNHLSGELLEMLAGVSMVHVPYRGAGSVMPDLLGGQVNALFSALPTVAAYIKSQKLHPIAVTTPKRFRGLPDVPTIAESGYPDYDFSSWFGVLAPTGTPRLIVERLHGEIVKALKDPGVQDRLADYEIVGSTPEEFRKFIAVQIEKTAEIIKTSGASID